MSQKALYAECLYAECRNAGCRYAECRGALCKIGPMLPNLTSDTVLNKFYSIELRFKFASIKSPKFEENINVVLLEGSGQCYKTFYGRNCVSIGVTQSKS